MTKYLETQSLTAQTCYKCSMLFAVPSDFDRRRRADRASFFCPAGHSQAYIAGQDDASRLRAELERQKQITQAAQERAITAEADRKQVAKAHTRMRQRVMNGVCPCCNRTFQNLMSHMRSEHPDFNEKRTLQVLRQAFGMTQKAIAKEVGVNPVYVSLYEREKPVPAYVKRALDGWIGSHDQEATNG